MPEGIFEAPACEPPTGNAYFASLKQAIKQTVGSPVTLASETGSDTDSHISW